MSAKKFYKNFLKIEEPHEHQIEVWEAFKNFEFPLLVKASTGSGKTEMAIARFCVNLLRGNYYD